MTTILVLAILGFQFLHTAEQELQTPTTANEELTLSSIKERIAGTSPEGVEVIERVKRMTPQIQKLQSAKTLDEAIADSINGQGQVIISPIGWEARKTDRSRWRIIFYCKDQQQKYVSAAWEYNQDKQVLLPAEFANATKFWVRRPFILKP